MTEYEYRGYTIRQYPHLITVLNPAGKLLSYWTDTRLAAQAFVRAVQEGR